MVAKLLRNVFLNASGQTVIIICNFAITPIFLRHLGIEKYGVWALILAISGTASGLDMGMNLGLMRCVPEYVNKREYGRLSGVMSAVIVFYLGLSLASFIAAYASGPWLVKFLKIKTTSHEEARLLILSAVAIMAVSSFAGIARSILQGLNRFDLVAILLVGTFVIYAVIGLILVSRGLGIIALIIATLIMFSVQLVLGSILVRRYCPMIFISLRLLLMDGVWKYLFSFGVKVQLSYLADIMKIQVPKLLAAAFFGPAAAAFYDLGNKLSNVGWTIPAAFLPAIIPAASEAETKGDGGKLRTIYLKGTRWLLVVSLPMGVGLALLSKLLFMAWLGPGYDNAAFVLSCLSLGNVMHLLTGVGTFIGRGISRPGIETRYQLITLLLYIALCYTLIRFFGFRGIPMGVALASTIGAIYFLTKFSKVMSFSLISFLIMATRLPVASMAPAFVLTMLIMVLSRSKYSSLRQLIMLGIILMVTYLFTLGAILFKSDKHIFKKILPIGRSIFRLNAKETLG